MGTYIWLEQEIAAAKKIAAQQIREKPESKSLVTLAFGPREWNEIHWEHEWEFEYLGQMYDVVERQTKGDTTILTCLWDQEETRLKKELRKLLAGSPDDQPREKEQQQRLQTFAKSLFAAPMDGKKELLVFSQSNHLNSLYLIFPSDPERSPPCPPPDLVL